MTRFRKHAVLIAAIFILAALMLCAEFKFSIPVNNPYGVIVDKFEGENGHYILLDTNHWVKVSMDDYIGLDVGDFYEEN